MKRVLTGLIIAILCISSFTMCLPKSKAVPNPSDLLSLPAAPYTEPPYQLVPSSQSLAQLVSVSSQTVNAAPGETVSLSLTYKAEAAFNPNEIDQLFFVESWTPSWPPDGYTLPVYNGIPGTSPGVTDTATVSFTTPSQSGTYYLWFCFAAQYTMQDAINLRTVSMDGLPAHVKIVVTGNPSQSRTILVSEEHHFVGNNFESDYFDSFRSLLTAQGYQLVVSNLPITLSLLSDVDVLLVFLPTEQYGTSEIDAVETFVSNGGGLFCIGDIGTTWRVDNIIARWGFSQASGIVTDSNNYVTNDEQVYYEAARGNFAVHAISKGLARVQGAASNWLDTLPSNAVSIITTDTDGTATPSGVSIYAALDTGTGRIAISMDCEYFSSGSTTVGLDAADNALLALNTFVWLMGGHFPDSEPPIVRNVHHEPLYPTFNDEISFFADVTDNVAVATVQLNYTLDGGLTWLLKSMASTGGDTYSTSLGPYQQFQIVGFYVLAYDTSGNKAYGSEIVPPIPEPPKVAPIVVSDQPANPLPDGRDIGYEPSDGGLQIVANVTELGMYGDGLTYAISYSLDGGINWLETSMTYTSDFIWTYVIPSSTNILFKIVASDGSSSRVYWIIVGPWEYPIYLYFSTAEQYFPVKGLDFDGDSDVSNNWASYETTPDNWKYDLVNNDIDGDGTPEVWSYAYMKPNTLDDGCLVVEYWIYYAFNKYPIDNHEHDFESVFIWVDIATGHIKKLACSQHMWVNHYIFDVNNPPMAINLAVENGGHGMALLTDKNNDGLPDLNILGSYIIQPGVNQFGGVDVPIFFTDAGTINPNSFVAKLFPWIIYDPRIPSSELHLFDDPSTLTNGLSLAAISPLLPSVVSDIPQYYGFLTDMLTVKCVLKTSYGAKGPLLRDSMLVFCVTAPLYRQEFQEPGLFWGKVSFGWWLAKQVVIKAISFFVTKGLNSYFQAAGLQHLLTGAAGDLTSRLTGSALNVFFDPVEGSVIDSQGGVLDCENAINNMLGGFVIATRNMTNGLYDDFLIFTNSSDEYVYDVKGIEPSVPYNFTLSLVDASVGEFFFNATMIPIHAGEVHRYIINWTIMENDGVGVQVYVDKNSDGVFEQHFQSGSELTGDEFTKATTDNNPPTTHFIIGQPKYVNASGDIFVAPTTSLSLTAVDNLGGSGVNKTTYRIYNGTYSTSWVEYTSPFRLASLNEGEYSVDYYSTDNAGNVETTNTATVFLDMAPTTKLVIGLPKYVSSMTYVTGETPFTLMATDNAGVKTTAYRITSACGYDSGWKVYKSPFKLTSLKDGCYTIAYKSTDNLGNVETTRYAKVTLFSWNYVYRDTYGRGTVLKINTYYKFFQFIAPCRDYGIRKATFMQVCGYSITINYHDSNLKLVTTAIDTKIDYCVANAWDLVTCKHYYLVDKPGFE